MTRFLSRSGVVISALLGVMPPLSVQAQDDFDLPPIAYAQSTPDNPISRLEQQLQTGARELTFEEPWGYLRSLLTALEVPVSSQTLVYSKTSLQRHRISPRSPRAIFFNDDVYIGYCKQGDVLEISVADGQLGTVFYTVDQRDRTAARFRRQNDNCLLCHAGGQTRGVPGHLFRSMYVDKHGQPLLASGSFRVDHTSPIEQRWGGWYVTGKHGSQKHLGNQIFSGREAAQSELDPAGWNVTDLSSRFDPAAYLSADSDLVALMVLGHQAAGHNVLTKALFSTKQALYREAALNRELGEAADHRWDSTNTILNNAAESLLKYFLFSGEAPLTEPMEGTTTFAQDFAAKGPRDRHGRSLRDFDLTTRLFRYPCSYLIYTESFDALPAELRALFWKRLAGILAGEDRSPEFAHLNELDRAAVREILCDTKPEAAAYLQVTNATVSQR